jgi:hypothetical protein
MQPAERCKEEGKTNFEISGLISTMEMTLGGSRGLEFLRMAKKEESNLLAIVAVFAGIKECKQNFGGRVATAVTWCNPMGLEFLRMVKKEKTKPLAIAAAFAGVKEFNESLICPS